MTTLTRERLEKSLNSPDEVRPFPNGKLEIVNLQGASIARITLRPGWKWSKDLKPTVKTPTCQSPHIQYCIGGRLMVRMDDGTQFEFKAGDAAAIPPGHDAWVVGSEPFIAVDFTGMKEYARRPEERSVEESPYTDDYFDE